MALFGIKQKPAPHEQKHEHIPDIRLPSMDDIHAEHGVGKILEEEKHEEYKAPEKTYGAPLFVKLDRYSHILNQLNEVKVTLVSLRNMFGALNEMEKLRHDTMKSMQGAIEKINSKLVALDGEFLRPSGFHEQSFNESYNVGELQNVLTSLKSQVEQLKGELRA